MADAAQAASVPDAAAAPLSAAASPTPAVTATTPQQTKKTSSKRKAGTNAALPATRGKNYDTDESVAITAAWILASQDAIAGTDQKAETFFSKMRDHVIAGFTSNSGVLYSAIPSTADRTWSNIQGHWSQISKEVHAFIGILAPLLRPPLPSGTTYENAIEAALTHFKKGNNDKAFKFYPCWQLLKDVDKFNIRVEAKIKTPARATASIISANSDMPDAALEESGTPTRPPGKKKAKLEESKSYNMQSMLADSAKASKERNEIMLAQKLSFDKGIETVEKMTAAFQQQAKQQNDDDVLRMDLTKYSGKVKEYWEKRQDAILEERMSKEN
ncbi:hypothetical protein HDU98_012326 [Podochytrium sp. JEL0797]|nr:hypothetical protein HDU98_012326 [Podochytrium sp. JEL0797]